MVWGLGKGKRESIRDETHGSGDSRRHGEGESRLITHINALHCGLCSTDALHIILFNPNGMRLQLPELLSYLHATTCPCLPRLSSAQS